MLATGDYQEDSSPSAIIVMGATGSGKTSFINLASGSKLKVGTNLESCTEEVQASKQFTVDGRPVVLVDTPGFHDTFKSDMDILNTIAQSLVARYDRRENIAGIIYMHRISDVRFTGTAVKSFATLLAMCGDEALRNVVIMTNMWAKVTPEVGNAREQELSSRFFNLALDKGALLLRHNDTTESAHNVIRNILNKQPVTLQIQKEIVDEWKRIEETTAGKELQKELDEQVRKRLEQLRELQEMLNRTEADDEDTRQELQQEVLRLQEELATIIKESDPAGGFRKPMQDAILFASVIAIFLVYAHIRYG